MLPFLSFPSFPSLPPPFDQHTVSYPDDASPTCHLGVMLCARVLRVLAEGSQRFSARDRQTDRQTRQTDILLVFFVRTGIEQNRACALFCHSHPSNTNITTNANNTEEPTNTSRQQAEANKKQKQAPYSPSLSPSLSSPPADYSSPLPSSPLVSPRAPSSSEPRRPWPACGPRRPRAW